MSVVTIVNQNIGSQADQSITAQEGLIKKMPPDIVGSILYFANENESTRLVSQAWNDLTFASVKFKNQELQHTIPLIIEKLNPNTQTQCIAELARLLEEHQFKSQFVTSFPEARQLFLTNKGLLAGILRKLPEDERDQLQIAIGEELQDSLKDVFEISKLHFMSFENLNVDTFFTLLQSYQPLSMENRGNAVYLAVSMQNIEFVKLLLASGPISCMDRGAAVRSAVNANYLKLVELLLANGLIFPTHRGAAVQRAASANNLELVKLLLADGAIPHDDRRWAIWEATCNMNLELAAALTDKWIIAEIGFGAALVGCSAWFGYKTYGLHCEIKEMKARISKLQSEIAELNARLIKAGLTPKPF